MAVLPSAHWLRFLPLKSQLLSPYTGNMDASFVLPARPLLKTVYPLLSIPHVKRSQNSSGSCSLGQVPSLYPLIVGVNIMQDYVLCAGTTQCSWGETRFRVGMISRSVSYMHRLNFYQVTYQTWRTPWTEKPSKLRTVHGVARGRHDLAAKPNQTKTNI